MFGSFGVGCGFLGVVGWLAWEIFLGFLGVGVIVGWRREGRRGEES